LGGGSSDAATVLLALDRLWDTRFGADALAELAPALGADVPFFLHGGPAWAEGIGDRLRSLELPPRWYLVLVPPVAVPTREVFAAPELTRDTEALKMEDFSAQPRSGVFHNDLQPVVTARYPEVRQHLEWLAAHAEARMTGSGSCVFAAFEDREGAQRVLDRLPASMKGFVAQGLARHPMRME
jgi:4-diphosphocytidyl-2-C-methyl-D-erythritol kinase